MSVFLSLILLTACEACDELAKSGPAHPFAFDAAWRPKCDAGAARFVEVDPWPKAGEVRRDAFTRDCADVSLTRAFVAAGDGFTAEELFVGAWIERKVGRGSTVIRQQEFLGQVGGYSYRYHVTADGQKVLASVEAPKATSHLVSTVMAPAVRASRGSVQTIACEIWRGRCELVSRRVGGDVALPFLVIAFDAAHLDGNLCVDVPQGATVDVRAGEVAVVSALAAAPGAASTCLGEESKAALERLGGARSARYRVTRVAGEAAGEWDAAELDSTALAEAVGLARFVLKEVVLAPARAAKARELAGDAEVLLDGAAIPN